MPVSFYIERKAFVSFLRQTAAAAVALTFHPAAASELKTVSEQPQTQIAEIEAVGTARSSSIFAFPERPSGP